VLVEGMRALGFHLLPDALQAPIIVTFHMPRDRPAFQTFCTASRRAAMSSTPAS
jgi:2-aminoethylphosphonate-pyruvate transaminase